MRKAYGQSACKRREPRVCDDTQRPLPNTLMKIYGIGDEVQKVSGVSQASSRVLTHFSQKDAKGVEQQ